MKELLLSFSLVIFTILVHAQVTTSNLTGGLLHENGQSAIGVSIKATHIPSGSIYSTSSNANGKYTISNMRVGGPYKVELSSVGFQTEKYENIMLNLGQAFILNSILKQIENELSEVMIIGQSGIALNDNKTGASTTINTSSLTNLPSINRSLVDFSKLTPQAYGNSFAGRDSRYNNIQIDGANFNNGFGISSGPLPGGRSQPISLDAIEEIQINIAPFDIRQSGFTGASINAITRSGTNTFTGSVYGYYTNQDFQGNSIGQLKLEKGNEAATRNFGFRLGGPLIKNKLFFFTNLEREEDIGENASGANLWKASTTRIANPDKNIARTKASDLDAVKSHLINQWGYDPGRYENYADHAKQYSTKFLIRMDWNINEKHKLALRYNQVIGISNQLVNTYSGPGPRSSTPRVGSNSITFENSNFGFENSVRSLTAELSSTLLPNLSNMFLATFSRIQDKRTSKSDHFPFVDIWDGSATGNNYMSFGYELFSYKNDILNDNYSFVNNLTYTTGNHVLTGGASFELQKFGNAFIRNGTSYYRYKSVEDFLTTGTSTEVAPIMFAITYPYIGQDPYVRINFGQASLYVQDRYTINHKLDLTAGLRAEIPIYMNKLTPNQGINELEFLDPIGNPIKYNSGSWPKSRIILSPRIGFNFDILGDRSLIARGGTGVFSGRVPFVWLTNMPTASGVIQNVVEPMSYAEVAPWINGISFNKDPYHWVNHPPEKAENVFIQSPSGGYPSTFALVNQEFKMPSVWRTSLGVDYKLPNSPLMVTTDLLYTQDINSIYQYAANRAINGEKMNYIQGDNRDFYTSTNVAYNANMGANNAMVLDNTKVKGNAYSATLGIVLLEKAAGFIGGIYYTYSQSKEVSGNTGYSASSAWIGSPSINNPNDQMLYPSLFAVPHRVNANLTYSINKIRNFPTTISVYYNGTSEGRFSYTYNGDFNGDGVNSDLIFLPKNTSDLTFVDITTGSEPDQTILFTAAEQASAFDNYISNNGLEKYRGQYLKRNNILMPWLNRFDIRVNQGLFAGLGGGRNNLQLSVDIINFGNLLNKHWGIQKAVNNAQTLLVPVTKSATTPTFQMATIDEDGQKLLPSSPFRSLASYSSTWKMQVGMRFSF